jgi:hypothetical protein
MPTSRTVNDVVVSEERAYSYRKPLSPKMSTSTIKKAIPYTNFSMAATL